MIVIADIEPGGKEMFKPTLSKKSSINILPLIDVIFFYWFSLCYLHLLGQRLKV